MDKKVLKQVHLYARKTVANLVREWSDMAELGGRPLRSLALTGDVLTPNWDPGRSDIGVVAAYQKLTAETLLELAPLLRRYAVKLRSAPVIVDNEYLAAAPGRFPLEFLDWTERHLTVWGEAVLDQIEVDESLIGPCVAAEFLGKLHHMNRAVLATQNNPVAFREFLRESIPHFVRLLRWWLKSRGGRVPESDREVIAAAAGESGVELEALDRLWQYQDQGRRVLGSELEGLIAGYWDAVQRFGAHVAGTGPGAAPRPVSPVQEGREDA